MPKFKCNVCGKVYNPETDEFCPKCGTATPPSILARVERKETAARLRAEGMTHYDDHCHEDDAWKGSYGAQTHRAAVRSHEESLRADYRAHSSTDVTTRGSNPNPSVQSKPSYPTQSPSYPTQSSYNRNAKKAKGGLLKALLPFGIILFWILYQFLRMIFGRGNW